MISIAIPSPLRSYTGAAEVAADIAPGGGTIADLLRDLDRRYPGIRFRMIDEQDRVRPHILIFVAGRLARDLAEPVAPGEAVQIVAALSGG